MRVKISLAVLGLALLASACFEVDEAVPSYTLPEDVDTLSIQSSIYHNQHYFDFSSGTVVAENQNSEWMLSFACADTAHVIRVNSSDFWGLAPSGSTRMDSIFTQNTEWMWKQDKSDGNPDSTAAGEWVNFESSTASYNRQVYLLGRYDGITYHLSKKLQFISVDELSYTFLIAEPDASEADTITVIKDDSYNSIQFSIHNNELNQLEPLKDQWDLLFTQYFTILYTDDGIPTPYIVRGVLLNPNQVEAALDTVLHFLDVTYSTAQQQDYFSALDAIGHDWKSVTVDEGSNSAEYKVRPGYTYLVKDTEQEIYKLRFKSYFNKSGIKGYPSIEFSRLSP